MRPFHFALLVEPKTSLVKRKDVTCLMALVFVVQLETAVTEHTTRLAHQQFWLLHIVHLKLLLR